MSEWLVGARHWGRRFRLRARPAYLAGACAGVAFVVFVVFRAGSEKLVPAPGVWHAQTSHGTWRHMFDLHGVSASIPLPLWILAIVGAGLIGFPYAWVCARALPDRGYGLARVVGLMLVTWVTWWSSSLRLLPFGRESIAVGGLVAAGGAAALARRHRRQMSRWLRERWKLLLVCETLFWVVFAAVLFVRWSNPDLWHPTRGGEKPMDFAYLNAVTKSTSFPPFDPWFGGGQMNYYYYGFVQVAALAKLTGIPPAIAYNLAIPTLAALLAAAVFSAALGLSQLRPLDWRRSVVVAVLAAVFVAVVGNLGEIRVLRSALHQSVPIDWWFWNPSRVISPEVGEPGPISEFPAFTFVFGDLHAHAMALPVAALAVALTVAVVRSAGEGLRKLAPCLALLALTLGSLWVTNSWDLPTYALLSVCGVALATIAVDRSMAGAVQFVAACVGMLALAYVAFLPFQLHYHSVFEGVQRWEGGKTGLSDYLTIHGLFLFAIASGLLVRIIVGSDLGTVARAARTFLRRPTRIRRLLALERAVVAHRTSLALARTAVAAAFVLAVTCAAAAQWPAAVAVLVGTLAVLAWPVRARPTVTAVDRALGRLLSTMVLLGLGLTVAVEYAVMRNIDVGRVNTVFKLYLQVWVLWGIAAAVSVGIVYAHLPRFRRLLRESWRLALVLLVAVAALYPVLASRAKIEDRFDRSVGRTLDGSAFMTRAVFDDKGADLRLAYDRDAMRWILENLDGSPIVAELNTAPTLYGWEGRYSVFTGNPTIVGWDYHERQQRPPMSARVQQRVLDVQQAYGTDDPAVAYRIFAYYGASYAVVGPLERAYFPGGTAKWARGEGRFWTKIYENPEVRIYRLRARAAVRSSGSGGSS